MLLPRRLIPMPASGVVAKDEASMRLLQMSSRVHFPQLMSALGYNYGGVPGQYGTGNRPRVDFMHVKADDIESFNLELLDCDLLLLHTPSERLEDARLESARWRLQRRAYSLIVGRLRQRGLRLRRDSSGVANGVHWAWTADGAEGDGAASPSPVDEEA